VLVKTMDVERLSNSSRELTTPPNAALYRARAKIVPKLDWVCRNCAVNSQG
jgi:hypothetical protein